MTPMLLPLTKSNLDLHARIECGLCHEKKCLYDIKKQLEEGRKWSQVRYLGIYICPNCYDKLYDTATICELLNEELIESGEPDGCVVSGTEPKGADIKIVTGE